MLLSWSLLALAAFATAAPSPRANHVVHEKRAAEPNRNWALSRRLEANKVIPMKFGLTQRNLHLVDDLLMSISHPESASYGQHMSAVDIVDMFSPSDETISAVKNWLVDFGLAPSRIRVSPNKGWIEVNVTTYEAEELLNAEYHVFEHVSGVEQIGCDSYSVPEHVREHIDLIKPTVHFNHRAAPTEPSRKRSTSGLGKPTSKNGPKTTGQTVAALSSSLEYCSEYITPACLQALYSIYYTPVATEINTFGIVELTPQAYLPGDLDMFFRNFTPNLVGRRPILVSIDGGVLQTMNESFDYNGESDLDFEYAMALTDPQPILLLQTGDLVEGASFDNWLDAVDASFCTFLGGDDPSQDGIYPDPYGGGYEGPESCGIIKPPNVVSTSYGQDEVTVTTAYAMRQCIEYAKLGLMGTTVLYASGDYGVAGFGGYCIDSEGQESLNGTRFNPDFPASCPYLTAVGATQINPNSTVYEPESACEQVIYSGGGFSNIFPMPTYQLNAVKEYLTMYTPPYTSAQYNNSGLVRGFPDVAANGANYVIGIDGEFELVYGTSAASPVFASVITLINDARLAIGKGPVGFINPVVYTPAFASGFHDITMGGNQGCGTPGFMTAPGWDPVTGNGTPNMTALLHLFLELP
ncbi:hypothetical protein JAAARDRAFT_63466 [Jaapia argillacea MUCL 33604]|uniref:tripeptidyl-peptidase II n=1 Tax=Jaapia argillacea MUCL 33604 TaxID=933084 RepID=A0A067P4S4_9AGAM|nr:hypothetical protein JAAARDRAFT_63466 [Jaapia argillacea MUCL 33604]